MKCNDEKMRIVVRWYIRVMSFQGMILTLYSTFKLNIHQAFLRARLFIDQVHTCSFLHVPRRTTQTS